MITSSGEAIASALAPCLGLVGLVGSACYVSNNAQFIVCITKPTHASSNADFSVQCLEHHTDPLYTYLPSKLVKHLDSALRTGSMVPPFTQFNYSH